MMNKKAFASLVVAGLAAVLPGALHAQSAWFRGNIPFDFVVGSKRMPAGEYTVRAAAPPAQSHLLITGWVAGRQENAVFLTIPVQPGAMGDQPKLTFNRYDSLYFLSLVSASESRGWSVPKSRQERELVRLASVRGRHTVALVAGR